MEYGYLWLALTLFLFLMTAGAGIALRVVAFPLLRKGADEQFDETFGAYRRRLRWSYGLLSALSVTAAFALLANPPYGMPDSALNAMVIVLGLLAVLYLARVITARQLRLSGYHPGRLGRLGRLGIGGILVWFSGCCLLVWAFVEVLGLA
ncbi:MAG: hypothetical protein R3284_00450 [Rubricoccaceae bacterium]|nr:hypothetical protein [Rubricoccaceae bacterium]